jgi:hypothetical protein
LTLFLNQLSSIAFNTTSQGHRLGEAHEVTPLSTTQSGQGNTKAKNDELPPARQDPNMTADEREQQRRERLAAAEARQKKAGGPPKKKKQYKDVPLSGPNSKPTMTWTSG